MIWLKKIKEVEKLVSEVASTSSEQNRGLQQINQAMTNLDHSTQANAALVEELSSTATCMSEEAEQQVGFISKFQISSEAQNPSKSKALSIDFADAKMMHNSWITKLEKLLAGQNTSIDSESARKPDVCPLGRWLYSEGQKYSHLQNMQKLIKCHAEFHTLVGRVIDACDIGDQASASQEKGRVETVSKQVLALIDLVEVEASAGMAPPSKPRNNHLKAVTSPARKVIEPSAVRNNSSRAAPISTPSTYNSGKEPMVAKSN